MMTSPLFKEAMKSFDQINEEDPNKEWVQGEWAPKELLYSKRMTVWLHRLAPEASEALKLAARSQHIARWRIPRKDYPMDRKGYLQWRTSLNKFHASTTEKILYKIGYDEKIIARVKGFLLKKNLKNDPEMQCLEDVICLVFLESYLSEFSTKHDEKKLITIIQKTWKKMTACGQQAALDLSFDDKSTALIKKALNQHVKPV